MKKAVKRKIKQTLKTAVALCAVGFIFMSLIFLYYAMQVPDASVLIARPVSESTKIYDRTGKNVLFDVHGNEKRTIVPWSDIPDSVKNATIAAEDADFYQHHGIDINGILRAFYHDITNVSLAQGGSTITQQLVKKSLFGDEKTISRKIKEAVFALQVERKFTKDQILWMYLNQIPYGSNIYGIETAAKEFFGKQSKDLTNAEAAVLASLIKAPTYYSPHGNHTDALRARKDYILNTMHTLGMISDDELQEALAEEIKFRPSTDLIQAPHFVMMVREYLINKYGEDVVQNSGLRVVTTLDLDLQNLAEKLVKKYGDINEKRFNAKNLSLVAADPASGQILAMVGSRDYFDVENDGNYNTATALRQPGSAFKPFAYATALNKGFTDSTVLFDVKTEFNPICNPNGTQEYASNGQKCYHPNNYNRTFYGPVTMRQALARSLNIPSVKTLYLAGIRDTIKTASNMGITTLTDPSRFGLSLVLGGAEVKLTDMVSAYGVFANDGVLASPTFIQEVAASDGRILEAYKKTQHRVLSSQIARLVSDILSDNNARAPVFGYNSPLFIHGRQVAAKTGTTQNNRDGWIIGYTPSIVVGVWGGNNDNSRMSGHATGAGVAGPLWHEFMATVLAGTPNTPFIKPNPIVSHKVMLNGTYLGKDGIHSILYYVDPNNPQGPIPSNPYKNSQFSNWEYGVQKWVEQNSPSQNSQQ